MQIANDRIWIMEEDLSMNGPQKEEFLARVRIETPKPFGPIGLVVAMWWAFTDENKIVAFGHLMHDCPDPQDIETVLLIAHVLESHRHLGLGRFMIRLATDQAIRYRKRAIMAEVENTNEGALKILDEEDFEKQPEQHPGYTLLKKELKWI